MPAPGRAAYVEETEEELLAMTREEACFGLNEKQIRFCEVYTRNYNIRLAAKQAGYSPKAAHTTGWKLRQNPDCARYIAWLKLRVANACHFEATDVIDLYTRIAFADITDFGKIKKGKLIVENSDMIDGQIVTSMKQTKSGVQIDLADKFRALEKLEKYFDFMPKDWKQKVEERKVELLEQRLELEKLKAGIYEKDEEDDGFIAALTASAEEVWEDDEIEDNEE